MLKEANPKLSTLLEGIEYSSSITLALGYRRDRAGRVPPGFGFLVPAAERKTLVACTFIGAKFAHRVPDSHVVLRCFLGGAGRESVLDREDSELVRIVRGELRALLGWDVEPDFVKISAGGVPWPSMPSTLGEAAENPNAAGGMPWSGTGRQRLRRHWHLGLRQDRPKRCTDVDADLVTPFLRQSFGRFRAFPREYPRFVILAGVNLYLKRYHCFLG